jgi:hypothetical protein
MKYSHFGRASSGYLAVEMCLVLRLEKETEK